MSHPEEILGHWFQLGSLEGSLAQEMQDSNNIYRGFKCVLLILSKILSHALTNFLFVTYFQWRYYVTLRFKKCVFHLHSTLYQGKRLFFISLFSLVFQRTLKSSIINNFLWTFVINNKTFYQQQNFFAFVYSFFLMLHSLICLIEYKTAHCSIQKFIKQKEIPLLIIFGDIFCVPIVVNCYHFGSRLQIY